jgi:Protein of unknown function DUF262
MDPTRLPHAVCGGRLAMNDHQDRKIEVKPSTLSNLVADVSSGRYRIPQFQREFVWNKAKVRELFDSIYHEYPIGSFFLWDAERERESTSEVGRVTVGSRHSSVLLKALGAQSPGARQARSLTIGPSHPRRPCGRRKRIGHARSDLSNDLLTL